MPIVRVAIWGAVALAASLSTSLAGPCSSQLGLVQAEVDGYLDVRAVNGPRAAESARALMHRQPTPASIAAAEENLGDLDARMFAPIAEAMRRARAADRMGDENACETALVEVQHEIGPKVCGRSMCR